VLPIGPSGDTVAASTGQGKTRRTQPAATATHRPIQPMPWVQPSAVSTDSSKPPIQKTSSALKMHSSISE
jgi:hypothetical protein